MKNSTQVRSNFHNMEQTACFLLTSVKPGKPVVCSCVQAVVGGLADGTDHFGEVSGVQLYVSGIYGVVQSPCIAFGNFYHSWVSVLMDHSDFDFVFVIIFF